MSQVLQDINQKRQNDTARVQCVLVVKDNVRRPDAVDGYTHVLDSAKQFRIPAKQSIVPSLPTHTDAYHHYRLDCMSSATTAVHAFQSIIMSKIV